MNQTTEAQVTLLLQRLGRGDAEADQEFYGLVYDELRHMAHGFMNHERSAHTLQTTALVHEAFLRLMPKTAVRWEGRNHFLRAAARTMRTILIDHARKRLSLKRGADAKRVALDDILVAYERKQVDVLAVGDALERLEQLDDELAQVTELRFFGGLTMEQVASVVGVSLATTERRWATARSWMRIELGS